MWKKILKFLHSCIPFILGLMLAFGVYTITMNILQGGSDSVEPEFVPYNTFLESVDSGNVDLVVYSTSEQYLIYYEFNDETRGMTEKERREYEYDDSEMKQTYYGATDNFRDDLLKTGIRLELAKDSSNILLTIANVLTALLPLIILLFVISKIRNPVDAVDKNSIVKQSNIKFSDVIGHDEVLDDVKFITKLIANPSEGEGLGVKVPKGILLSGEPGTGKTLLAKAIAGEAGVPFLYMNASNFIEMYVGVGAKRVRELFKIARDNAPCIVFIDEIDSIGIKRSKTNGNSEGDQTINALLQEMDGFTGRDGIFLIAATNRADALDKALTRTGRFDRQIVIHPPRNWKIRYDLFKHYLDNIKISEDVDIERVARQTVGFTGSDIATICNEAGIVAMMHDKQFVDNACLEEAIDKHVFKGNRSKKKENEEDRKIVAYHEAGHAVMNYLLDEPISRISIIGTTSGVGGVVFGADSDSAFMTKDKFRKRILSLYAGRASEAIGFDDITTGASNDIEKATEMLMGYVMDFGFCEDLGLLNYRHLGQDNKVVLEKVQELANKFYEECFGLLSANYNKVEKLAQTLLDCEIMSGNEVVELLNS